MTSPWAKSPDEAAVRDAQLEGQLLAALKPCCDPRALAGRLASILQKSSVAPEEIGWLIARRCSEEQINNLLALDNMKTEQAIVMMVRSWVREGK